jgi:transposase-like protein
VNCPICSQETFIVRTDDTVRRRKCKGCGHAFTTAEVLKAELERRERIIEDAKELADRIRRAA